jgi:hypothetical protein
LSIADAAGGEWPVRARAAAVKLTQADGLSDQSTRVNLLHDIRTAFEAHGEKLPTKDLIASLVAIEERPWGEWKAGKALSPAQLAKLVAPFDIMPTNLKMQSGAVLKGYRLQDFEASFSRYLPENPTASRYAATLPAAVGQLAISEPLPDCDGSGIETAHLAYSRNGSSGVAAPESSIDQDAAFFDDHERLAVEL